jgi:hypothetical protein
MSACSVGKRKMEEVLRKGMDEQADIYFAHLGNRSMWSGFK